METVSDRFLRYVRYHTTSNSEAEIIPSTSLQTVFANELVRELMQIGLKDVAIDDHSYVMATLPSNMEVDIPVVGFVAHMDTSPDFLGEGVNPQVIKKYAGGSIVLNNELDIHLKPEEFPELNNYIGQDIITTDGTTLLGADDKAGIAEIITAMEYLIEHPEIKHGKIRICFTPDEEVGKGADLFDVAKFGASFAYTIDGSEIGELEYENFNAAYASVTISGRNVHPGYAKNKMVNSMTLATKFAAMLPEREVPECTSDYEGFFHLISIKGEVEQTQLKYIIRDFDAVTFGKRKDHMSQLVQLFKKSNPEADIKLEIVDQYFNMRHKIEPVMHIVDMAQEAMVCSGVKPLVKPIRGGTDGARLSYMGLPTPNVFAGGHNFHGRFEFVPIQSMEKAVEVIVKISELVAARGFSS